MTDIIQSAKTLIDAANQHGLTVRVLGGVAVAIHCPEHINPGRSYRDIDACIPAKSQTAVSKFLVQYGYEADKEFNLLNGDTRLLFHDPQTHRQLDVFVGEFAMCHRIPLSLNAHPYTVAVAELLLTKLQIIKLNPKDAHDGCALLHYLHIGTSAAHAQTRQQLASLCGNDWGLWRTFTLNLERCVTYCHTHAPAIAADVASEVGAIRQFIDATPKNLAFKMRATIGDKVKWYEEPEEVER
jgi:hypothetical protein